MSQQSNGEQVVMTPKSKTNNSTTILIERRHMTKTNEHMHIAGGEHTGIIINKERAPSGAPIDDGPPPDLALEFRVFLVSAQTGKHVPEQRILRFWFRSCTVYSDEADGVYSGAGAAQNFFRELVSPQDFPRDYVGFIKKIIKLMQLNYNTIEKVEVEMKQLEDAEVPTRPLSAGDSSIGQVIPLTKAKVLEIIESSYPNPVTIHDIAKAHGWDEAEVANHMSELQNRAIVKAMDHGAFTRQQSQDTQVIIVKQMPTIASSKQPTIAIITAQYCEKLAVDAMIENKETFVRYTTVGESNVYTLGNIGAHRVVCTKLPSIGHTREAMTAAGNTTTRLLGTFQKVEYVFLVGVGGGVPHYTDFKRHVRLGDVVISSPNVNRSVYTYCENSWPVQEGFQFEVKHYNPDSYVLQDTSRVLANEDQSEGPWLKYLREGLKILGSQSETDFTPPSVDTDKLYMNIGDNGLIEVAHPKPQDKMQQTQKGFPRIHLATIASGRQIVKDDTMRTHFAEKVGAMAFDCEFDSVIESVLGNCKESFIIIRGISDYKDGTKQKEWQPYASLAAASMMKAIICGLEPWTDN